MFVCIACCKSESQLSRQQAQFVKGCSNSIRLVIINARFDKLACQISLLFSIQYCRVMLGGEIYCKAIGRPWVPASDFIVTVKFLTAVAAGPALAGGPGRPRAVGATRAFKFESGLAGIKYSGPLSAGCPPEPSVCPTVRLSVCPWPLVCLHVRPVRSCCTTGKPVFRSGTVKKKYQGQPFGTSLYTQPVLPSGRQKI